MQVLIVTGMSGSGKSSVMDVMEDIGFYCIDNIPPKLITQFVDLCRQAETKISRIAVAVDVRAGDMFSEIYTSVKELKKAEDVDVKVLFVEANHEVLLRRYKETRRRHPLAEKFNGNLHEAINYEHDQLAQLRGINDYYIDTTTLTASQLKEQVRNMFLANASDSLTIKVMSFGYKYGVSTESDLMFDVRCLPNPYYIAELKNHTGLEACVSTYVMSFEQSITVYEKFAELLDVLIPLYVQEGKSQLTIAFGCTGGKHRSVTFAERIAKYLKEKQYKVQTYHRDIKRV